MTDHRQLAVELFNHTWSLLSNNNRSPQQDEEMVHAAHVSRNHWGIAGTPIHHARGDWQLARVYAVLGRFSESEHYAKLYLEACTQNEFDDWDLPFAYEAMARSCVVNPERAKQYLAEARKLGEKVANDDDKQWLFTNLDEIAVMIDGE